MKKKNIFSKPKYIAHKINDTSINKKSPFCTIEEINNENSQNNIEPDLSPINRTAKSLDKNIFSDQNQELPDYYDKFIGPRFDSNGNLIKYSIVGKPERFLRKYNQSADNKRIYESKLSIYSPKNAVSTFSIAEQEIPSTIQNRESNANFARKTISKANTFVRAAQAAAIMAKIIPKRNIIRLNHNQVKYEIEKVENRLRENISNDNLLLAALKTNDQLYMNKEQRILKKNAQNHEIWDNQLQNLKKKVPRSKSEHLIQTSENFRYKKEKAEIFDLLKTDHEKYGNKYWYSYIRNNINEELQHVGQETLKIFNKSRLNLKNNQIEMIRPLIKTENSSSKLVNLISLRKAAEKNEYMNKILNRNKKKMEFLQPPSSIGETVNGFQVVLFF